MYKWGYASRMGHIISINEDVQYKRGISSVQIRICSGSEEHHQVFEQGGITQINFVMNNYS